MYDGDALGTDHFKLVLLSSQLVQLQVNRPENMNSLPHMNNYNHTWEIKGRWGENLIAANIRIQFLGAVTGANSRDILRRLSATKRLQTYKWHVWHDHIIHTNMQLKYLQLVKEQAVLNESMMQCITHSPGSRLQFIKASFTNTACKIHSIQ